MNPLQNEELKRLLAACARRDEIAFGRLYELTAGKLFGTAVRILKREDWAEEVLQDCYVSIWNNAASYMTGLSAPMTWMTSIVRNRCLDWLRRPNPAPLDDEALQEIESGNPGPLALLEQGRDSAALARCLRGLEARQRQAIALAFFDGLSHAELAQHLREPLGTVKTWVRRGLAKLRSCLELQG